MISTRCWKRALVLLGSLWMLGVLVACGAFDPAMTENEPGEMGFQQVESQYEKWMAMEVTGPPQDQVEALEQKLDTFEELDAAYEQLTEDAAPYWEAAARFRRGDIYQYMADFLLTEVPVPYQEGTEEYWTYRDLLDDVAFPLEDHAVCKFEELHGWSQHQGVVNDWTDRGARRLEILKQHGAGCGD